MLIDNVFNWGCMAINAVFHAAYWGAYTVDEIVERLEKKH